jgi:hypothetical protein
MPPRLGLKYRPIFRNVYFHGLCKYNGKWGKKQGFKGNIFSGFADFPMPALGITE